MSTPCVWLEWDTGFFGHRIAQVTVQRPSPEDWSAIDDWCQRERIECLYFLADEDDETNRRTAERRGFGLMDWRLTLERTVVDSPEVTGIRSATKSDIPALRAMTIGAYPDTRFSRDPRFAPHADRFYATWIERNVEGLAEAVIVIDDADGRPAAFASCHLRDEANGQLGLLGVRADTRGRGFGSRLVAAAFGWFRQNGRRSVLVVTNGNNHAARKLYEQHGFRLRRTQLWYHRWFDS